MEMLRSIRGVVVLWAGCCAMLIGLTCQTQAQLEFKGSDGVAHTATIQTQTNNTQTVTGTTIMGFDDGYGTYPHEVTYSYSANSAPSIVSVVPLLSDSWFGGLDFIYPVLDSTTIVNTGTKLELQVGPDSDLTEGQMVSFSEYRRYSFKIKMKYHYVCPLGVITNSFGATTIESELEAGLPSRGGTAIVD